MDSVSLFYVIRQYTGIMLFFGQNISVFSFCIAGLVVLLFWARKQLAGCRNNYGIPVVGS